MGMQRYLLSRFNPDFDHSHPVIFKNNLDILGSNLDRVLSMGAFNRENAFKVRKEM
jgi:hypothetical protein